MTDQQAPRPLTDTIGAAVLATRGVACLRPGLAELLRSSVGRGAARGTVGGSGVRVRRRKDSSALDVEVYVVLARGHRALDVTRAVRSAVLEATAKDAGEGATAQVRVTVTGVV